MDSRERFKVKEIGGEYCDFEESSAVSDAFELLDPNAYPEDQRTLIEEFNRRAEAGNRRYRIAMYRAEMFEKGFNAGMYICTFDHDENMTSFVFTDETRRLLGYDGPEDLPNEFDSWVKTLLPEQRDAMVPVFWSTVKAHRQLPDISHAEYPMVRKDGKIIWVTGAGRFIRREDGSLEIYMGCYRDVTAEHEKDDYLHIIEGIGKIFNFSLYIDMASETYRLVSTNEYVEKVRKDPNAFRFLRDNVDSSVHPDYREELKAWFRPEIISALLRQKDIVTKDFFSAETDMWFRAVFMVGDKKEDGSLNHIIYGCQDITYEKRHELRRQKHLEEVTAEQEAQLEEITDLNKKIQEAQEAKEREHGIIDALATSYLNVYTINVAERTVEIVKLDGYLTSGLSKKKAGPYPYEATCRAYISGRVFREDQEMVAENMALDHLLNELKDRKEYSFSYRVTEKGEIRYYQGKYVTVDGGYIICGFQNIDEIVADEKAKNEEFLRAKENAEAANRAKTAFLFNMSHDIRTPMNAIIGYANLMKRKQGDMEKWPDYLDKILASGGFLLGLINNVLEMARIESGKTVLDEQVYPVDAFVDQLYSVFADEMGKKDIRFTKSVDVKHSYLYVDTVKLKEIYLNIISNAQKYTMPGGAVDISVKELPSDEDGRVLIRIAVSDTGIGMSEEFLPHIFEEFTRERNSAGNRIQGTGLGMPIVKKLVDLMDGTIEVQSAVGKGSTFIVTIPHRIAEKPAGSEKSESIDCADLAGKRILLAEDNDLNAEIAMEILSEYGFRTERAEDGALCVDMLEKAQPGYYDLILMDIQMPNLDGYGAARKIRRMEDPVKAGIPIIAMTANAFEEDKRNAADAGMDGHVAKPIEIPALMQTLAGVLKGNPVRS